jgi:hypothetical protein
MEFKIPFATPEHKITIVNENQNLRLIDTQILFEGNFLIFTDEILPLESYEDKPTYEELENQILKMADIISGGVL